MFVDLVQLCLHLDGEVDEVAEVRVLVHLRLERVDAGRGHVRAADCLDLLDRPELFVVQNLVEVDWKKKTSKHFSIN